MQFRIEFRPLVTAVLAAIGVALTGCGSETTGGGSQTAQVQSCMTCHNASFKNDYSGPGIENPHPFGDADNLLCTDCHGGNPNGDEELTAHVPPPPEIGDNDLLEDDTFAYFNRLTLTGLDKLPNYQVNGKTYKALDYLQFINPGDLRVVTKDRSCGACHESHADCVNGSLLATSAGILSGAMYAAGVDNEINASKGLYEDTAADKGFRAVNGGSTHGTAGVPAVGPVDRLIEYPVFSAKESTDPNDIVNNDAAYLVAALADDVDPVTNQLITGSPLANLYHEQVAFTCGDCHLGSAGANNRAGDFRSSGCTACHMPYSLGGRSGSLDPNVNKEEPLNPDQIRAPERSHVRSHRIVSTAKTLPGGEFLPGIDDYACAGCHQGSNRTVMQYWGIRLDQNEDLRRGVQYPSMPASFVNTHGDERLFDPVVKNKTFNGRDRDQYILFEDYDGDGRDDTPADVHYDAGMGCIDCHGSFDLHGGDVTSEQGAILSRMEQAVAVKCESCHGSASAYAATQTGEAWDGTTQELALDSRGNVMDHVVKEGDGFWLYSRLTGARHYVGQTRDYVVDSSKVHPLTQQALFSPKASYAMGRDDGLASTGIGPQQSGDPTMFAHYDSMDCASCHSSWTNTCMGCHLVGDFDNNENFSNITGQEIVFEEDDADFVYQSPVFFQLGVNEDNRITQVSPNTKMFFTYKDRQNQFTPVHAFTDRNEGGNNPNVEFPSLSHNAMMAHSIRGKVSNENEGPRYCVSCHITQDGLDAFELEYPGGYDKLRNAMSTNTFSDIDFDMLAEHIGQNPSNQKNSPVFVHMVAGLGSGLFLFDENGCPTNPLDNDDDRAGCNDKSPAEIFNLANVAYNLDRIVGEDGKSHGSSNHAMLEPNPDPNLREGADDPNLSGPLGSSILEKLTDPTTGVKLDSYLDADGTAHGGASGLVDGTP